MIRPARDSGFAPSNGLVKRHPLGALDGRGAAQQHHDHDFIPHDDRNHHSAGGGSAEPQQAPHYTGRMSMALTGTDIYDLDRDDVVCEWVGRNIGTNACR